MKNQGTTMRYLGILMLIGLSTACRQPASTATPPDAIADLGAAKASVGKYLALRSEGSGATDAQIDSVAGCFPDGIVDPLYTLGAFEVLDAVADRDTIMVRTVVSTIAEERSASVSGYLREATIRFRQDTATWRVVRNSAKHWTVCGLPRPAFDLGHIGDENNTRWLSPNSSWARVRAIADSMKAARSH